MTHINHIPAAHPLVVAHRLDGVGWGLCFVWVGVALMADLGWGLGLLGLGVITLAQQAARRYFGLAVEWFWVVVGFFFALSGVGQLLALQFSLVPIILIVAGAAILFSALRRQHV
jgi:hypothetical protein